MNDFIRGRQAENEFAKAYLQDINWATKDQDMFEHWDVEGILIDISDKPLKFDVKALKKVNRADDSFNDDVTWIEGTNVHGHDGWIKGKADYIVFEREDKWTIIKRDELFNWTINKIRRRGKQIGKGLYQIYQRPNRKDKLTLINFSDIDNITVLHLPK